MRVRWLRLRPWLQLRPRPSTRSTKQCLQQTFGIVGSYSVHKTWTYRPWALTDEERRILAADAAAGGPTERSISRALAIRVS
jgi:hypothetical protein